MHQRTISHYITQGELHTDHTISDTHTSLQYMYVCTLILIQLDTVTV